jgi:hypothetical protein
MHLAVGELRRLLSSRCVTEESYQSLLASNPWILGAQFEEVMSHPVLDDENVPDFAVRLPGSMHWNLVEIKQPFLPIFRKDGGFSTHLNAAWEQADRYVRFTKDERRYLRDRKHLSFHDTRCTLVVGYDCTDAERRRLADRAATSTCVEVQTWRELLTRAEAYLAKVEDAHRQQVWDRSSSAESRDESST